MQSQNEILLANRIYPWNHGVLSVCLRKLSFSTVWKKSKWFTNSKSKMTSHLLTKVTKSSTTKMDAKVHHMQFSIIFWIQISLDTGNKNCLTFCSKCFLKYLVENTTSSMTIKNFSTNYSKSILVVKLF